MPTTNYILTPDGNFISENELYHHGIKGMKWGVRRYQNKDGSLTNAGKKRYSKEYEKLSDAAMKDLQREYSDRYVKSYNKAADYMNSGGIDKFNAAQRKKYGDKYSQRDGYESDYYAEFEKHLVKNMNKSLDEFYRTNTNVQKAKALADKYKMTEWNEMAKQNMAAIEEVRRAVEDNA